MIMMKRNLVTEFQINVQTNKHWYKPLDAMECYHTHSMVINIQQLLSVVVVVMVVCCVSS